MYQEEFARLLEKHCIPYQVKECIVIKDDIKDLVRKYRDVRNYMNRMYEDFKSEFTSFQEFLTFWNLVNEMD